LSELTHDNAQQNMQVDSLQIAKNEFFYYKNHWWQKLNLLDEYEKFILKDGKVITDKIKSIIFKSMLMNIMPLN
jgi:hypothetical protein